MATLWIAMESILLQVDKYNVEKKLGYPHVNSLCKNDIISNF